MHSKNVLCVNTSGASYSRTSPQPIITSESWGDAQQRTFLFFLYTMRWLSYSIQIWTFSCRPWRWRTLSARYFSLRGRRIVSFDSQPKKIILFFYSVSDESTYPQTSPPPPRKVRYRGYRRLWPIESGVKGNKRNPKPFFSSFLFADYWNNIQRWGRRGAIKWATEFVPFTSLSLPFVMTTERGVCGVKKGKRELGYALAPLCLWLL